MSKIPRPVTHTSAFGDVETVYVASANGAVPLKSRTVFITKSTSAAALTLADATGLPDGTCLEFISTTAKAHTVSNAAGSGFNGGGAGSDVATFGGAAGDSFEVCSYGGKWYTCHLTNVTLG